MLHDSLKIKVWEALAGLGVVFICGALTNFGGWAWLGVGFLLAGALLFLVVRWIGRAK